MIQDRQIKVSEIEERHEKRNSEKSSSNATSMKEIPIGDF